MKTKSYEIMNLFNPREQNFNWLLNIDFNDNLDFLTEE